MKKFYTLLGVAVAAVAIAWAATAELPVTWEAKSAPSSTVNDDAWTACKASGTTLQWTIFGGSKFRIWANPAQDVDTWLVTPAFEVKKGYEYKVTFRFQLHGGDTKVEHLDIHFTHASPLEDMDAALASAKMEEYADLVGVAPWSSTRNIETSGVAAEDGKAYVAFHLYGNVYQAPYVYSVSVEEGEKVGGDDPDPVDPDPVDPDDHECAGLPTPYIAPVAVSATEFSAGWTTIDANGDGNNYQWKPSVQSNASYGLNGFAAQYQYSSYTGPDDYLISPAIHLQAGKEYKVIYWLACGAGSDKENLTVYASTSNTDDAETGIKATGIVLEDLVAHSNKNTPTKHTLDFTPEATGDYHIVFYLHSEKYQNRVYISALSVLENVFTPAPVGNLTAVAAPAREMKVTLSWTLPTLDAFDTPIPEDANFEKVEIFRDGAEQPIATLAGDATTFEDTADTGLASGYHTYNVAVTVNGASAGATVTTSFVGPLVPNPVPYTFTVSSVNDLDLWTVEKGAASTVPQSQTWYFSDTYSGKSLRYQASSKNTEDDWLISPPLAVAAPGYYRVSLDMEIGNKSIVVVDGYVGSEDKSESMTLVAKSLDMPYGRSTVVYDFYAPEAGTYYTALHTYAENRTDAQNLYMYGYAVAESQNMPAAVTNLTAKGKGQENVITVSWNNSDKSFAGTDMPASDYKVLIYLNGGEEPALTVTDFVTGEQANVYEVPVDESGVYTVTVKTVGNDDASAPKHPTVNAGWIGSRIVEMPYATVFTDEPNPTRQLWEIVDANQDGFTWTYDSYSGFTCQAGATEGNFQTYDDYFLSPYFELAAGDYRADYQFRGGNKPYYGDPAPITYTMALIPAGTFDPANPQLLSAVQKDVMDSSYQTYKTDLSAAEDGTYQVVIAVTGMQNKQNYSSYYPAIKSFSLKNNPTVPGLATEVTVTPAEDSRLEATISWLNPTDTNKEGVELKNGEIVKAVILRNGEAVGEVTDGLVPGATSTYVDNTLDQAGIHKYSVEIHGVNGKHESAPAVVTSEWIGGGLKVPYTVEGEGFELFTIDNADDDYQWGDPLTWSVNWRGLVIAVQSKDANDWAISPLIEFEENTLYKIAISGYHNTSAPVGPFVLDIYAGQNENHRTDYTKVGTVVLEEDAIRASNEVTREVYIKTPCADAAGDETAAYRRAAAEGEGEGETEVAEDPVNTAVEIPYGNTHLALFDGSRGDIVISKMAVTREKAVVAVNEVTANNGVIVFDGKVFFDGTANVEVYTVSGALVAAATAESVYSLEGLANGVYVVRIATANGIVTVKVAK